MATLELYLIRHGLAAERGPAWPDDSKRPLTSRGIAVMRREGRGLKALGVGFDVIISSPLVRARQTAEAVAEAFTPKPPIVLSDALAPAGAHAAVLQDLARHARKERIALVGHEPNLGELAARLLGLRNAVPFKKGAVCRLDFAVLPPKGRGELRWFATPKMLRKLG
jgi:phosphohistidine phosphatase